jgi:anti-sigma B factor antagonist
MQHYQHIVVNPRDEVAIVRFVDRRITASENIQAISDELIRLLEVDERHSLLLNFEGVEFMSSSALNALLLLNKRIKAVNGQLRLCNLRPEIRNVFEITQLDQLFHIHANEAASLAAF